MRRVLMVSNFLSSRGTSRGVCEELAAHLSQSGNAVITTSSKSNKVARLADMIATTWRFRHQYDVAQIDIYSGSAFLWAEAVCAVLKMLGKPFVLSLHGGALPEFAERWPRRVKRLLAAASTVTTPSGFLREKMSAYRSDLTLIPNSLSIEKYAYRQRKQPKPNLIWLRSIHQIYNPVQAVDVLAGILPDFPDAHLTMVGPDKGDGSRQQVERRATDLRVREHLTLTGVVPKSQVPSYLQAPDIFLNTTNVDNTPISVIEAMACGLCIVSTNVGGLPYLLRDGEEALLVPPQDPQAMIAAVRRILSNPPVAALLSENARKKTEQFDWSNTLPAWQEVLCMANADNRESRDFSRGRK